jgi:hypothetical protein
MHAVLLFYGDYLGGAGISAESAKSENMSELCKASPAASVQQTALLDDYYL